MFEAPFGRIKKNEFSLLKFRHHLKFSVEFFDVVKPLSDNFDVDALQSKN